MDEENLQEQQVPQVRKTSKVLKVVIMILILFFAIALIFYFWKPYLFLKVDIQDKKDSYKLGETITLSIEIKNYSFLPFKKVFSSTDTDPSLSIQGIKPKYHMLMSGQAFTTVEISPFGSKIYTAKINLVNEESWVNDAGMMSNYDLVVKPGENVIVAEWFKQDSVDIYIDPEDFYEEKIDCNLFGNPNRQDQCNFDFLEGGAESVESCRNIYDDFLKENCFGDLAAQKRDSSFCDELEGDDARDGCIWDVYYETKDKKYCEEMKDPSGCYYNYAGEVEDSSFCDLIPNEESKDNCYRDIVNYHGKDYTVCSKIGDEGIMRNCYFGVCKEIEESLQSDCYKDAAINLSDSFACGKILDEGKKNQCNSLFEGRYKLIPDKISR